MDLCNPYQAQPQWFHLITNRFLQKKRSIYRKMKTTRRDQIKSMKVCFVQLDIQVSMAIQLLITRNQSCLKEMGQRCSGGYQLILLKRLREHSGIQDYLQYTHLTSPRLLFGFSWLVASWASTVQNRVHVWVGNIIFFDYLYLKR